MFKTSKKVELDADAIERANRIKEQVSEQKIIVVAQEEKKRLADRDLSNFFNDLKHIYQRVGPLNTGFDSNFYQIGDIELLIRWYGHKYFVEYDHNVSLMTFDEVKERVFHLIAQQNLPEINSA